MEIRYFIGPPPTLIQELFRCLNVTVYQSMRIWGKTLYFSINPLLKWLNFPIQFHLILFQTQDVSAQLDEEINKLSEIEADANQG